MCYLFHQFISISAIWRCSTEVKKINIFRVLGLSAWSHMWFYLCSLLKTKQRFHCVWASLQSVLNSLSISILSYMVLMRKCWEKPTCLVLCLQLRNLVWATSKHDVYFTSHYSIRHWSALSGATTELMNVEGHVAPREVWYVIVFSFSVLDLRSLAIQLILLMTIFVQKRSGSLSEGFSQTQVSTLAVKDNLLVAGGFQGELICKVSYEEWFKSFSIKTVDVWAMALY